MEKGKFIVRGCHVEQRDGVVNGYFDMIVFISMIRKNQKFTLKKLLQENFKYKNKILE